MSINMRSSSAPGSGSNNSKACHSYLSVVMDNSRPPSREACHQKSSSLPAPTATSQPGHRRTVSSHLTPPGYERDQIPRLSCFISLLVYHVWTSKTLSQTLDVRNTNQFLITFVKNILEITRIPLPVVTLAVKYLQRLRRLRSIPHSKQPTKNDETRIFSVALILAQKYSDDTPYGNKMWGKVLGLNALDLTRLEIQFLGELGYNLYVPENEYGSFCRGVQALAREWNASIAMTSDSLIGKALHIPRPIVTSNLPQKQSLQTPTSSTESLAPNQQSTPAPKIMTPQEITPPITTDTATSSTRVQPPKTITPLLLIPSTFLPPRSNNSTPTPSTLEEFLSVAPKTYGLLQASSVGASPVVQIPGSHQPQYYVVATPQFVLLPSAMTSEFSNDMIHVVSAKNSRATSPAGDDGEDHGREVKRAKYC